MYSLSARTNRHQIKLGYDALLNGRAMNGFSRRQFLGGAVATAAAAARGMPAVHAQKRGGTLRFVAQADLKVVDPSGRPPISPATTGTWCTTPSSARTSSSDQAADGRSLHRVRGRDEVHLHPPRWPPVARRATGPVGRLCGVTQALGQEGSLRRAPHGAQGGIAPVDQKTFTLELAERFSPVLDALGKPSSNVPFMMPARIAATSPDEEIKEIVGSGPFEFVKDEWQPGRPGRVRAQRRLRPPQGGAERVDGRQEDIPRQGGLAVHSRSRGGGGGPRGGRGRLVGGPTGRLHPEDRAEPGPTDVPLRSPRDAGLAPAEPPSPALQQQESAPGTAPHDGPGNVSALGHRTAEVLPAPATRFSPAAAPTPRGGRPANHQA